MLIAYKELRKRERELPPIEYRLLSPSSVYKMLVSETSSEMLKMQHKNRHKTKHMTGHKARHKAASESLSLLAELR